MNSFKWKTIHRQGEINMSSKNVGKTMDGTRNAAEAIWKRAKRKERGIQSYSVSLHSSEALMLESERKHTARQLLKAMQGTEFFTLQMVYHH